MLHFKMGDGNFFTEKCFEKCFEKINVNSMYNFFFEYVLQF